MINPREEVTLEKIDFEWVKEQTKPGQLKKALKLIEQDGNYFVDLKRACEARLIEIDPKYKTGNLQIQLLVDPLQVDPEERQQASKEFETFLDAPALEKNQRLAESEKQKGNEALRSNDLKEALNYYTKSIEFDKTMAASYCNRALVHLKLKEYQKVIDDCNKTLEIQKDYIKAYHRRGKAYFALQNFTNAYLDFKYIIEKEPETSEVNGELRECRKHLTDLQIQSAENKQFLSQQGAFKKVQIQEESDEEEMEIPQSKQVDFTNEINAIKEKKEKIAVNMQKGLYHESILQITELLKENQQVLELSKSLQLLDIRAQLLSNLTLCHFQQQEYSKVVEYTTLIINDHCPKDVEMKAYLRRALAYEHMEKLSLSKQDFYKVKELDPGNLQASQGLSRLQKIMNEDEHNDFNKTQQQQKLQQSQEQEQNKQKKLIQQEIQQNQVIKNQQQEIKETQQNLQSTPKPQQQNLVQELTDLKVSEAEIQKNLQSFKDQGNDYFKKGKQQDAYDSWSQGIAYYEQNPSPQQIQIYLTLLTNSSLCLSQLGQNELVIQLSSKALSYDPKNVKALYRRGIAYQQVALSKQDIQEQNDLFEKSRADLEKLVYLEPNNKLASEKLTEVTKQNVECRVKLKQIQKQEPIKIHSNIQNQQEEVKETKQKQDDVKQSKNPQIQQLQQIGQNLAQTVIEEILQKNLQPETASVFEKNMNSFKKATPEQIIQYVSQVQNFQELYSKKELPSDVFLQILQASQKSINQMGGQIKVIYSNKIAKTAKLDLCTKLLLKKEKESLKQIFTTLGVEELIQVYKL
ncbi:hypothetical protein pb186bvf_004015 [Paramecium bursaria]